MSAWTRRLTEDTVCSRAPAQTARVLGLAEARLEQPTALLWDRSAVHKDWDLRRLCISVHSRLVASYRVASRCMTAADGCDQASKHASRSFLVSPLSLIWDSTFPQLHLYAFWKCIFIANPCAKTPDQRIYYKQHSLGARHRPYTRTMAPTKKDEKEAKLTPEQSATLVLDYLRKQNRPYSATDISSNLKNRVTKTAAAKLLKDMHERSEIEGRAAGKQLVYHAIQVCEQPASCRVSVGFGTDALLRRKPMEHPPMLSDHMCSLAK